MTRFWDGRTDGQTDGVTALIDLLSPSATQVKKYFWRKFFGVRYFLKCVVTYVPMLAKMI